VTTSISIFVKIQTLLLYFLAFPIFLTEISYPKYKTKIEFDLSKIFNYEKPKNKCLIYYASQDPLNN